MAVESLEGLINETVMKRGVLVATVLVFVALMVLSLDTHYVEGLLIVQEDKQELYAGHSCIRRGYYFYLLSIDSLIVGGESEIIDLLSSGQMKNQYVFGLPNNLKWRDVASHELYEIGVDKRYQYRVTKIAGRAFFQKVEFPWLAHGATRPVDELPRTSPFFNDMHYVDDYSFKCVYYIEFGNDFTFMGCPLPGAKPIKEK